MKRHYWPGLLYFVFITVSWGSNIEWKVTNTFADLDGLDADHQSVWFPKKAESGNLESFEEWYTRISSSAQSPYAEISSDKRVWDGEKHRYRPDFIDRFVHSKTINITAKVKGEHGTCVWRVNGKEIDKLPCEAPIQLDVPEKGASLDVLIGSNTLPAEIIKPKRIIILGLGDSIAAGEGNPDRATQWKSTQVPVGNYRWLSNKGLGDNDSYIAQAPIWMDHQCHRSFWNYQTYIALKLAAESPRQEVVLLDYACSGAEIFDGLLVRQANPPGAADICTLATFKGQRNPNCLLQESQVHAALEDLCPTKADSTHDNRRFYRHIDLSKLYRMQTYRENGFDLVSCKASSYRPPDVVLLSVGGNDVGFASLVSWAILPIRGKTWFSNEFFQTFVRKNQVVCPDIASDYCKKPFDRDLTNQIGRRQRILANVIEGLLKVPKEKIVLTAYPDPIRKTLDAKSICSDPSGLNYDNGWDGVRSLTGITRDWEFNIVDSEARVLIGSTIPLLNSALENAAKHNHIHFIPETADALVGHGWCETSPKDSPIYLPSTKDKPWLSGECSRNPSCWKPMASRKRYFRTTNDSLLTQTSDIKDGINGTMHPTAQGQAAIADRVYGVVRGMVIK